MKLGRLVLFACLLTAPIAWAADELAKPPEGWKESTAKDKSFAVWMPESQGRVRDNIHTAILKKNTSGKEATQL